VKEQYITVLGATGSIGRSTLDVIRRNPGLRVYALTANRNWQRLLELAKACQPEVLVMADPEAAEQLTRAVQCAGLPSRITSGEQALCEVASHHSVTTVMAAIVGGAGLPPVLAAARAGKKILLANKEALVMAGPLFLKEARDHGATILPVDSEHNALFQCLPQHAVSGSGAVDWSAHGVKKLTLTASGGPFREWSRDQMKLATPEQAVAHPNWSMGAKISVDSATLMNKGLEVIEASLLFSMPQASIDVVIHPESIVHSLVHYVDGSVLAQAGRPDMRTPIAHALAWPERISSGVEPLDLVAVSRLRFQAPDLERFPCLALAFEALRKGESAPTVLNAANEVAVEAFLAGRIGFMAIPELVRKVMDAHECRPLQALADVYDIDNWARRNARDLLQAVVDSDVGSHNG
jgi:1-deoxy-D-xylulose-5-phosphate reductoisomerase